MKINKMALVFCLLAVLALTAAAQSPVNASVASAAVGQEKKLLYARLGGYDAIAAVVDDFIGRLATDQRFERFFGYH